LLVDIEGGEYELLKYAVVHTIKKLMIEIHSWILTPEQIRFVKDRIAHAGFHLVEVSGKGKFYFER